MSNLIERLKHILKQHDPEDQYCLVLECDVRDIIAALREQQATITELTAKAVQYERLAESGVGIFNKKFVESQQATIKELETEVAQWKES